MKIFREIKFATFNEQLRFCSRCKNIRLIGFEDLFEKRLMRAMRINTVYTCCTVSSEPFIVQTRSTYSQQRQRTANFSENRVTQ